MAEIKKISTELQLLDKFLDTSGDAGTSGQVLTSTGTGINWVSGGSLPGGPYLPLSAGSSYPLTGTLYGTGATFGDTTVDVATVTIEGGQAGILDIWRNGTNASYQAIRFRDDTNANTEASIGWGSNQLRLNGTNTIIATTSNIERIRIDPAGNVGIGTTGPSTKLEVVDTFSVQRTSTDNEGFYVTVSGADANAIVETFYQEDSNSLYGFSKKYDGSTNLYQEFIHDNSATGTEVYRVNRSTKNTSILNGNVGIGTDSPDYQLDVENTTHAVVRIHAGINSSASLRLKNDAQDWDLNTQTNDTFAIYNQTSGTQPFSILPNGNVGIGTTAPERILHLDADQGRAIIQLDKGGDKIVSIGTGSSATGADDTIFQMFNEGSELVRIFTEGNSWFNGGNVGIGTTSPDAKLDVEAGDTGSAQGDSTTAAIFRAGRQNVWFQNQRTAAGTDWNNNTFKIIAKVDSTSHQSINFVNDTSYNEHIDIYTGNQVFNTRFTHDGNVGIGTTSPGAKLHVAYSNSSVYSPTSPSGDLVVSRHNTSSVDDQTVGIRFDTTGFAGTTTGQAAIQAIQPSNLSSADLAFLTRNNATFGERMRIDSAGAIKFNAYDSTNNTGTPTYLLGTDASGNIVKTLSFDPPTGTTQFFNQSSSYNNSTSGVTGYGNIVMDTSVSYYDTGKNVPTQTRGMVWTGKHYIVTRYTGPLAALFYSNNFDSITNPEASSITLPPPSSGGSNPHGAAWDGRYLYCVNYTPMKILAYDLDNGTTTATVVSETDISSYSTTTYDIEYAEGHLYTCADGKVSKFKVEGKTITHVFTSGVILGTIDAQAITYDGSYLWFTQNGQNAYKVSLDCVLVATITTGLPTNNVAWAWNGQNVAAVNHSTGDVYIVNTAETRFDTEEFLVMGGNVGIGTDSPQNALHVKKEGYQLKLEDGNTTNTCEILASNNTMGFFSDRANAVASSDMIFSIDNDTKMVIDTNGNVGIGTDSPTEISSGATTLEISGTVTTKSGALRLASSDNSLSSYFYHQSSGLLMGTATAQPIRIITNNSEKIRIESAGNVGIGTTSPGQKLHVNDGSTATTTDANNMLLLTRNNHSYIMFSCPDNKDSGLHFHNTTDDAFVGRIAYSHEGSSDHMLFTVSSSVRMDISASGAIRFNNYGAGTLVSDASGNITVSSGGGAGGPFLPLAGGTMSGGIVFSSQDGATCTPVNWLSYLCPDSSGITVNAKIGEGVVIFPDNSKVTFGNSSDVQIYHNGSNSFIENTTGDLYLKTTGTLRLNSSSNESMITATKDGTVQLFYDNAVKLATTATGVSVTGTSSIFSSGAGANGDCVVVIEADTNNAVENSNPILQLKQDGGSLGASFGLNGDANDSFTGAIANGGYVKTAGAFQIAPGNLLTTTFLNGGNVGIGTNNPLHALEVYGDAKNIAITNTAETDAGIIFRDAQATTDQAAAIKFNSSDQKLKFFVNDEVAQRMVIDTSGNVGIGTSTPDYKLEVDGTMFSSGNFGNRNSAQTIGVQFEPGSTTATTMAVYSDELKIYYKGPNTTRFELEESGTARKPGGGSWSSTSDKRVKKDITNYTKGLTEILAIQPVNYKYNGKAGLPEEKQQVGVVAQDIQAAFPNAVETYKALFNNDDTEETELLAFNPSELTFTLINAVKELKAEIELLKQQINN